MAPYEEQEKEEEKKEDVEWYRWLPGFAVGGNALTSVKDFPAVQAGAVFGGHTLSSVVFILVVRAVAAALATHADVLRRKPVFLNNNHPVFPTSDYRFSMYRQFTEAAAGFSNSVNLVLHTVYADLPISAPWQKQQIISP